MRSRVMGGCKSGCCFWRFLLFLGKRTRDFAFVSLCYGRSGEEICTGYAMAASGRMQYDYNNNNNTIALGRPINGHMTLEDIIHIRTRHVSFSILIGCNSVAEWLIVASTYHLNSDPK